MWNKELEISKEAAIKAGAAIMKIYEKGAGIDVEYKADNSPLTEADKASQSIINEMLTTAFPSYSILSEESEDDLSRLENDLCFIVDPLDGTKEFIKRNGQFTVNIALSVRHRSEMGVIYVPVTGELYYASRGDGAFRMTSDGDIEKLHVSGINDVDSLRVVISNSHDCKEMDEFIAKYNFKNLVKMGSSLKGCVVARGDADIYYRFNPTMEWDTAAMQCITEEAGAVFRQMDDSEMLYNRENSRNDKGFYVINREENRLR